MRRRAIILASLLGAIGAPTAALLVAAIAAVGRPPPVLTTPAQSDQAAVAEVLARVPLDGLPNAVVEAIEERRRGPLAVRIDSGDVKGDVSFPASGRTDRDWGRTVTTVLVPADDVGVIVQRIRAGWPAPLLDGWAIRHNARSVETEARFHAIRLSSTPDGPLLPISPRWLALAVTSLAGAAIAVALSIVPAWLRARSRRRRGACVRCGYPIANGATCPECGS